MPKDRQDIRARLQSAAMELFHERGYDRTTAAEIGVRASVTERTFFRYFPDMREVLVSGDERGHARTNAAASYERALTGDR